MAQLIKSLLKACHFLPTLTVTTISFALAYRVSDLKTAIGIAITVLAGQLIVGWSNDLIDYSDDLAHRRMKKPLVAATISLQVIQKAILIDIVILLLLTFIGPFNGVFGVLHLLAITSAIVYNLKLKQTVFSFFPYALSFALLPITILGVTNNPIKWWFPTIGALFGVGAHVANVFKDLEHDRESGIKGLPQLVGEKISKVICALTFGSSAIILYTQTNNLGALIILGGAIIFLLPIPRKAAFPFAMALGLGVMMVFIDSNP